MGSHDDTTLGFYAAEAERYVTQTWPEEPWLDRFLTALPVAGRILELGCGSGRDSAAMLARGFDVTPTDGTPEIAREAEKRLGRPVRTLLFEDLDETDRYDGVWASACLLHVPRDQLPGALTRIHAALRPGGLFYASFKAGLQDGRDAFGRYFNYPSPDWLRSAYDPARWAAIDIVEADGSGYDDKPTPWLHVMAKKHR